MSGVADSAPSVSRNGLKTAGRGWILKVVLCCVVLCCVVSCCVVLCCSVLCCVALGDRARACGVPRRANKTSNQYARGMYIDYLLYQYAFGSKSMNAGHTFYIILYLVTCFFASVLDGANWGGSQRVPTGRPRFCIVYEIWRASRW